MDITLGRRVFRSAGVRCEPLGDEAVLHDASSGRDFALDGVGARVWQLLGEDAGLAHAFARLREEFDVDDALLREDLVALVTTMAEAGLVRVE